MLVSGLTIEKVPSPFSCNCWVECPWVLWYLVRLLVGLGEGMQLGKAKVWGLLALVADQRKFLPRANKEKHVGVKTYFRPFWFLYAFSHPMTGQRKGLCSSVGGIMSAVICCRSRAGSVPGAS